MAAGGAAARRLARALARVAPAALALALVAALPACSIDPDPTRDGRVDVRDVSLVSSCQAADPRTDCRCAPADVDHDADVDAADLQTIRSRLGMTGLPVPPADTTPPSLVIERPAAGASLVSSPVRVRGRASEPLFSARVAGVAATLDASDPMRFEARVPADAGANVLSVVAQDLACLRGEARVRVDLLAGRDPDPTGDGRTDVRDVSLVSSCQSADLAAQCRCRRADVDGDADVDAADLDAVKEALGTNGWPIDPADATPPVVALVTPAAGAQITQSPLDVEGSLDDPAARVRVNGVDATITGAPPGTPGAPASFRARIALGAGPAQIEAVAEDAACNVGRDARDVVLAPVLVGLDVEPAGLRFEHVPASAPLHAIGRLSDGTTRDLTDAGTGTVWSTERAFVAQVDANGGVTAVDDGATRVRATNAALSDDAAVVVEQGVTLVALDVTPPEATLRQPGASLPLAAHGSFSDGSTRDLTRAESGTRWSSDSPQRIEVTPDGVAIARAPGTATITASNGALADTARITLVLTTGPALVRGEAFDDALGLPLGDVEATLLEDGAGPVAAPVVARADAQGRFALPAAAGPVRVRIARPGHSAVERTATPAAGRTSELVDARLTPLDGALTSVSSVLGGRAASTDARAELELPPASLPADTSLRLTPLSAQGLPALLPPGFSPIAAADVSPAGVALARPATLRLRAALAADPARLAAVRRDAALGRWIALDPASLRVQGDEISVALDALAPVVIALADATPLAPPLPAAAGDVLQGIAPAITPADLALAGRVDPPSAPAGPEARARGTLAARSASAPSSGLVVRGAVSERYDRLDGTRVEPLPFEQDVVLYQRPAVEADAALSATLPITPSRAFTVNEIASGAVTIDVRPGRFDTSGAADGGALVDASGARVEDAATNALVVPAGALATPTAARLIERAPGDLAAALPPGFTSAGVLEIDLAGATLAQPAALSLPRPGDVLDGETLLVVQEITGPDGVRRLRVVALAGARGTRLETRTQPGDPPLEGVRAGGVFAVLRASGAIAFAAGTVRGADATMPRPGALVTATTSAFADVSDAAGAYVLALPALASGTLAARDLASGEQASASFAAPPAGTTSLDLVLGRITASVVSSDPADQTSDVSPRAAIELALSDALDAASLASASVRLTDAAGAPVSVDLQLSADARRLRIVPRAELAGASAHALTLSGLRDQSGGLVAPFGPLRFTTRDESKPAQPAAGAIVASLPADDGTTIVRGTQGTSEANAAVTVTNPRTRETATALALPDGSFRLQIAAALGDELALALRNAAGRSQTIAITRFEGTDGSVGLGEAGGSFDDGQGRSASVLPRALRTPGVLRLSALDAAALPASLASGGVRIVDALALALDGVAFRALRELVLAEEQDRFAGVSLDRAPFTPSASLVVPSDFLVSGSLRFSLVATDEDGIPTRADVRTVVVDTSPDASTSETVEAARFPRLRLRAPAETLRGRQVDVAGTAASARVELDLPLPSGAAPGDALLLARVDTSAPLPRLLVVDRFDRTSGPSGERIVGAGDELAGATQAGEYAVVALPGPLAQVEGRVSGARALVLLDGSALAVATDGPNGRFVLPLTAGAPYRLSVIDAATGAVLASAAGVAPAAGASADAGDPTQGRAGVLFVGSEPRGDAIADASDEIVLRFSEPIDATSVTGASVPVRDANGTRVAGRWAVSADGLEARFRPVRRFRLGGSYGYTLSTSLRARSGARPDRAVVERFSVFAPSEIARLALDAGGRPDPARDLAVAGDLLVVGSDAGLRTIDVRIPAAAQARALVPAPGGVGGVELLAGAALTARDGSPVSGTLALAASGDATRAGRLEIYDVADPAAPRALGGAQLTTPAGTPPPPNVPPAPGVPSAVSLLDARRAGVAVRDLGVVSVSLDRAVPDLPSDPGQSLGPRHPASGVESARATVLLEDVLLVAGAGGLSVLDATTLALRARFDTGGEAAGVAALPNFDFDRNGDGTIAATGEQLDLAVVSGGADGTLQLVDVSDRAHPLRLAVVRLGHAIGDVVVDARERIAVVTGGARGIAIVDLDGPGGIQPEDLDADAADDRILGRLATAGDATRLAFQTTRAVAWLADATGALAALQLTPPRSRILDVARDPLSSLAGDERSIATSRVAYTTDTRLVVQLFATPAARGSLSLQIEETPRAGGVAQLEVDGPGGTGARLLAGRQEIALRLRAAPGSTGSDVRLRVQDETGRVIEAFTLRLDPDDVAAAPAQGLVVSPVSASVAGVGERQRFELGAVVADGSLRNRTLHPATRWSVDRAPVAAIDAQGEATAAGGGEATVTASAGGLAARAALHVGGTPAPIALELAPFVTLRALGATQPLPLRVVLADGTGRALLPSDGASVSASDPAVASLTATGDVTALAAGLTRVSVQLGAFTASTLVEVDPRPAASVASIAIRPVAPAPSTDEAEAAVEVQLTGTGALELLPVTLALGGAHAATLDGITERDGVARFRVTGLATPGHVTLDAALVDPASGATRRASAAFDVARGTGDHEPNDAPASASRLAPGRLVAGSVGGADARDAFAVTTPRGGTLEIDLSLPPGATVSGLALVLRDATTGAELARVVPRSARETISLAAPRGAVVLALESSFAAATPYTMSLSVTPPPVVVGSVSDARGGAGSIVTITGSGFSENVSENVVQFGGVRAEVIGATPSELRVLVPAEASNGPLDVIVGGQGGRAASVDVGSTAPAASSFGSPPDPAMTRQDPVSGELAFANRLLVLVAPSLGRAVADAAAAAAGGSVAGAVPAASLYALELPSTTLSALEALRTVVAATPGVLATFRSTISGGALEIDAEETGAASVAPSSFAVPIEPWMALQSVHAFEAARIARRTPPFDVLSSLRRVTVAVIDTGFSPQDPSDFLRQSGGSTVTVIDPLQPSGPLGVLPPAPAPSNDLSGHGTAVASVIALANNAYGSSGLLESLAEPTEVPGFQTLVYQAGTPCASNPAAPPKCIDAFRALLALSDVAKRNALGAASAPAVDAVDVVNASFATIYTSLGTAWQADRDLWGLFVDPLAARTLVVVAAGNVGVDARHSSIASLATDRAHVMAVGATGALNDDGTNEGVDRRAHFGSGTPSLEELPLTFPLARMCQLGRASASSCGEALTLVAPGEDVVVSYSDGMAFSLSASSPFRTASGTSFSAPVVSAVAAMAQAIGDPDTSPRIEIAPAKLRQLLVETGADITGSWKSDDPHRVSEVRRVNAAALMLKLVEGQGTHPLYVVDAEAPHPAGGLPGAVIAIDLAPDTGQRRGSTDVRIDLDFTARGVAVQATNPRGASTSPLGHELYVVAEAVDPPLGDGLVVIDTEMLRAIDFIPLSGASLLPVATSSLTPVVANASVPQIAVTPDARLAYVNAGSRVVIVNLVQRKIVQSFADLPAEIRPTLPPSSPISLYDRLQDVSDVVTGQGNSVLAAIGSTVALAFRELRSLSLSPDGRWLWLAVGTGTGGGVQPGAVIPVNVDLGRDTDPGSPGVQPDASEYFVPGVNPPAPLVLSPVLHMLAATTPNGVQTLVGDEPSDVAASFDGDTVYMAHGGLERAQGFTPDLTNLPELYSAMVLASTLGAQAAAGGGGLLGLLSIVNGNLIQLSHAYTRMQLEYRELMRSGRTILVAPGYTAAFKPFDPRVDGAMEWVFPANVGFSWSSPPGKALISQTSNETIFASRPSRIVVDALDPRETGLVTFLQTGNVGFLARGTQALFAQSPPVVALPTLFDDPSEPIGDVFRGVVAVTPSLSLDNHAWPDRGRFQTHAPAGQTSITVPSPDEAFLFPNGLALASSGGFAAVSHAGAGGAPRDVQAVVPPFDTDTFAKFALEELGYVVSGATATRGAVSLAPGLTHSFRRGGGGITIVDRKRAEAELAAKAATQTQRDAVTRPWFSGEPLDGGTSQDVVRRIEEWRPVSGTPERFHRPKGVAIQPGLVIASPLTGDEIDGGTPVELRWREAGVVAWKADVWDTDVLDANGDATHAGGVGLHLLTSGETSARATSARFADLAGGSFTPAGGHRYRAIVQLVGATGSIVGRARVEGRHLPSPAPTPITCSTTISTLRFEQTTAQDRDGHRDSMIPFVERGTVHYVVNLGAGDSLVAPLTGGDPIQLHPLDSSGATVSDLAVDLNPSNGSATTGTFEVVPTVTTPARPRHVAGDFQAVLEVNTDRCGKLDRNLTIPTRRQFDAALESVVERATANGLDEFCTARSEMALQTRDELKPLMLQRIGFDPFDPSPTLPNDLCIVDDRWPLTQPTALHVLAVSTTVDLTTTAAGRSLVPPESTLRAVTPAILAEGQNVGSWLQLAYSAAHDTESTHGVSCPDIPNPNDPANPIRMRTVIPAPAVSDAKIVVVVRWEPATPGQCRVP